MAAYASPRPLREDDNREPFDCGRESLNAWFKRNAWRNQASNVTRTSVLIDTAAGTIAGYISLSAGQIEREALAKADQRNRPTALPALLLGQLAIDRRHQGRGCARSLMLFACRAAVRISEEIGCFGMITHPLDDDVRAFYAGFGFQDVPFDPRRAMIIRTADLISNGLGAGD